MDHLLDTVHLTDFGRSRVELPEWCPAGYVFRDRERNHDSFVCEAVFLSPPRVIAGVLHKKELYNKLYNSFFFYFGILSMIMIELELTYLAKYLPEGLKDGRSKKIIDGYVEDVGDHPTLRLRQNGDIFEITRKKPVEGDDRSKQIEDTISIDEVEFAHLIAGKHRMIEKTRYYYEHEGVVVEFDIFEGDFAGLVVVDVEFEN